MGDYTLRALVIIEGNPLAKELEKYIEQVVVDDHLLLPGVFTITLLDPEREILERAGLRVGSKVEVWGSKRGDPEDKPLIHGEVTANEGDYDVCGARLVVRGYDTSHRLHLGRHTRTYLGQTDSDIAKRIADEARIEIGQIEPTTEVHEHVSQGNLSHWDFLKSRARQINFELAVVDGKFYFRPPQDSSAAPGEGDLRTATDPRQLVFGTSLLEFHPRVTAAQQVAEVEVRSWDEHKKEAIVGTAKAGTVAAKLDTQTPSGLAELFGALKFVSSDRPVGSNGEADGTAGAIAEQIGSAFAEAEGVARGDPLLRAGTPVSITGVAATFVGRYVLSHVRHVFDSDGYRTHFDVSGRQERSILGLVAGAAAKSGGNGRTTQTGLAIAIVTGNADPEKMGRVKLKFPWMDDNYESHWARVVQLGAGPQSGAVFLPEVGDEVLVGFEHGDFRFPYVIGGLYNGRDKPRLGEGLFDQGKVKRRGFVSRKGHRFVFFDDDKQSGIALLTADGNVKVALKETGSQLQISCAGDVTIHAGGKLTITSDGALNLESKAQLTIKGSAGVKIQSGAVVDIDGSIIQLN